MDRRHFLMFLSAVPVMTALAHPAAAYERPAASGSPKAEGGGAGGQLRMALVTATVLRRSGRRGIMSVESTLDIADAALLERAKLSQPRLNAAFNEAIQIEANRMLANAVPDLDIIGRSLQRTTDRVLGRAGAKVLLGTVMVT